MGGGSVKRSQTRVSIVLVAAIAVCSGCAAIHPIRGVPVEQLMLEGESRSDKSTIDLSLLEQSKPDQYRIGPRDVLSVYVPGVLGRMTDRDDEVGDAPPINLPQNPADLPTIGFPLTVRDDGTLPLPQIRPVYVQGLTLGDVEDAIIAAYTEQTQVLNGTRAQVIVSLARPREIEVLVVRQEKSSEVAQAAPNVVNVGRSRRGTARIVRLPAYKNDVLHALAKEQGVDGLPGLDAENTIYIIRRRNKGDMWPGSLPHCQGQDCQPCMTDASYSATPVVSDNGAPPTEVGADPQYTHDPRTSPETMPVQRSVGTSVPSQPSRPDFYRLQQPVVPAGGPAANPFGNPRSQTVVPTGHSTPPWNHVPQRSAIRGQSPRGGHAFSLPVLPGHAQTSSSRYDAVLSQASAGYEQHMQQTSYYPTQSPSPEPVYMPGHTASAPPVVDQPGEYCEDEQWSWQDALADFDPTIKNPHVIKIPVRLAPGERPCFNEQDIILDDGDVIFIESRETEVFYTAGLLGGGQWELPRDYDLRLLEAIAIAQGPQNVQSVGNSNGRTAINGDVTVSGSHVVILRTLPGGARVPISTSIYKAIKHPDEHNVKIQPGDMIYLQYTCVEGVLAFFERHLLESALFGVAAGFAINDN